MGTKATMSLHFNLQQLQLRYKLHPTRESKQNDPLNPAWALAIKRCTVTLYYVVIHLDQRCAASNDRPRLIRFKQDRIDANDTSLVF